MAAPRARSVTLLELCDRRVRLRGLCDPIDNDVRNAARAGQTIPVKYRLTWPDGTPVSDPARFVRVSSQRGGALCLTLGLDLVEEASRAGGSELQYLGDGNWQFNWKTEKSWDNQCRTMILTLQDGSTHTATFKFR
jgi:hypothetical protein